MIGTKRVVVALAVCLVALSGCKTRGQRIARPLLPEGAPQVEDVLRDLAENDVMLQTLDARGRFIVESPDLGEGKVACNARIWYRRPTDLRVAGTHQLTGVPVFNLTCAGDEFYLEFPTEKKCYYFIHGARVEAIDFSISPSDVAKEMFLAESWADLDPRDFRIEAYDPATGIVTAIVGTRRNPRRRLELAGPPWHVIRNVHLNRDEVMSETALSDYYEKDGVRFPRDVTCTFPSANSSMKFRVGNPTINPAMPDERFHIDPKAAEACSNALD